MADNVAITPGVGTSIATDDIGGVQYQRVKVTFGVDGSASDVNSGNPLPVTGTFFQATQPVSGTFWQATQPVSIAATVAISATALPLPSGAATETTLSGLNTKTPPLGQAAMAASSPVVIASNQSSIPVTGTFWQATQPVSGTFWQATQPVSGTITITPPTLTKGTQGATGVSVQELKDAGRSCISMTAEFTFVQTAETLLTMTVSVDGAATSTFSSRTITSGKKFRLQSVTLAVENLGSGTAPQRAYLRLRRNTAGATTASSALQAVWGCINSTATVKSGIVMDYEVPDGMEMNGDGTATFGFTLETPDWVTSTATGRAKITVLGFEY